VGEIDSSLPGWSLSEWQILCNFLIDIPKPSTYHGGC